VHLAISRVDSGWDVHCLVVNQIGWLKVPVVDSR
jgi:hypothetical protein